MKCHWLALVGGLITTVVGASPLIEGLARSPDLDERLVGEVLIAELGCARCHADLARAGNRPVAPVLGAVGERLSVNYLRAFLEHPQAIRPGTRMPDLLRSLGPEDRAHSVRALAAFLTRGNREPDTAIIEEGDRANGKRLFESIGCVVCHPDAVSLGKGYSRQGLRAFLEDPLSVRPSGRMPDLHLTPDEARDLAEFLVEDDKPLRPDETSNASLVREGREQFSSLGCARCHALTEGDDTQVSAGLTSGQFRLDQGCLSGNVGQWPAYDLSEGQRRAIRRALESTESLKPEETLRVALHRFDCVACHERGGFGGVVDATDHHFSGADLNLGEQGRLPPSLNGVGGKLKPEWLRKILVQGAPARPYLHVRMPRFGRAVATEILPGLLLDPPLEDVPVPRVGRDVNLRRGGRDLAGTDGLSCVTCHTFRGQTVGAMGAIDLTLLAQRVTRNWFHHYLRSPQSFSPSTLMPEFWVDGQSVQTTILEGDTLLQIEGLWQFLSEGYGMGTPKGVRREPMRLLAAKDEAVMLRRSYRGVGKRGIGVGYPGGVNLVFSAEQMCLAMVWQGEFLDPSGVWLSQGHGTARPLARDPVTVNRVPELEVLGDVNGPWPTYSGRSPRHQFNGYRLETGRRPRFFYRVGEVGVEDSFEDRQDGEKMVLRRSIHLKAPSSPPPPLVFRAAVHKQITQVDARNFKVGEQLHVRLRGTARGLIVAQQEELELRVVLDWQEESSVLVLDYVF